MGAASGVSGSTDRVAAERRGGGNSGGTGAAPPRRGTPAADAGLAGGVPRRSVGGDRSGGGSSRAGAVGAADRLGEEHGLLRGHPHAAGGRRGTDPPDQPFTLLDAEPDPERGPEVDHAL